MEFKKLKLKKWKLHPITTIILSIFVIMLISTLLSLFDFQVTYAKINPSTMEIENTHVAVEGLFNFEGLKFLVSNAARNFVSFTPLSTLLLALVGLSVAYASGFIDTFIQRKTFNLNNKAITFLFIFIATISSIINDVGYVVLIPLSALIFLANGRSPLLGITTSFCGVAFSYGASLFAGSTEISLVPITQQSAYLIDSSYHVGMLSNLFVIIISSIVLSIVGTIVIENVVLKRIGKYRLKEDETIYETKEIKLENVEKEQQLKLETEIAEKRGLKYAYIAFMFVLLLFIYAIIPGLPFSGFLLDMNESAYINQLFGDNSYFQDGFTYLVSFMFLIMGLAYAYGAKSIKSDKDLVEKCSLYLKDIGYVVLLVFFMSQLIAVFKKTNIGTIIVGLVANLIKSLSFTGLPLIITVVILIAFCSLFVTTQSAKWTILAPSVVPLLMQANVSPQFTQFLFRAGDSMTKGITPLLAYFVIYLAYLNIYNTEDEPITIRKALSFVTPYFIIISITWLALIIIMYVVGVPVGPGVFPSL